MNYSEWEDWMREAMEWESALEKIAEELREHGGIIRDRKSVV